MTPLVARIRFPVLVLAALCLAGLIPRPAAAANATQAFQPLTPEERALEHSKIDPDADAEILDWDVRIEDGLAGNSWHSTRWNYVRVKVFTDHGRDDWTRI